MNFMRESKEMNTGWKHGFFTGINQLKRLERGIHAAEASGRSKRLDTCPCRRDSSQADVSNPPFRKLVIRFANPRFCGMNSALQLLRASRTATLFSLVRALQWAWIGVLTLTATGAVLSPEIKTRSEISHERIAEIIRPTAIRPESGFGYIAQLTGGRSGDKGGGSACRLLEDGKPLSGPRSRHTEIRNEGRGRYSHWTEGALYFSSSDNSDPRTNGRKYELVSEQRVRRHQITVRVSGLRNSYSIPAPKDAKISNRRLEIRNLDSGTAVIPKIAAAGWPDLTSSEGMLKSILKPKMTDEEKTLAIWKFLVDWRYHYYPAEGGAEVHDPVRFINVYGYGFCDDSARNAASLARLAGLKSRVWGLDGHVVAETFFDGRWHMIDPDHEVFYRMPAGHIASVEELSVHPEIIRKTPRDPIGSDTAAIARLYTTTDNNRSLDRLDNIGHRLEPVLQPGDKMIFDFSNRKEVHAVLFAGKPLPPIFANGRLVRKLGAASLAKPVRLEWPYAILGGGLRWAKSSTGAVPVVEVSTDGRKYDSLDVITVDGEHSVGLDKWVKSRGKAVYGLWLRLRNGGDLSPATHLECSIDFQFAPRTLPQVKAGGTHFDLFVRPVGGVALPTQWNGLEVIHEWQEVVGK